MFVTQLLVAVKACNMFNIYDTEYLGHEALR